MLNDMLAEVGGRTDIRSTSMGWSRDQFIDDLPAKLAELLVASAVEVGELVVIETEEVKQGDVDVADGMLDVDGLVTGVRQSAKLATLSNNKARFD